MIFFEMNSLVSGSCKYVSSLMAAEQQFELKKCVNSKAITVFVSQSIDKIRENLIGESDDDGFLTASAILHASFNHFIVSGLSNYFGKLWKVENHEDLAWRQVDAAANLPKGSTSNYTRRTQNLL
jgi:hypothetical protein